MQSLTTKILSTLLPQFASEHASVQANSLYGVDNGKTIGTFIENLLFNWLRSREYDFVEGNSASGLDFPELNTEIKSTLTTQPQSSCPFHSVQEKVFGLGYNIILLLYTKEDGLDGQSILTIQDQHFIPEHETADHATTLALIRLLQNDAAVEKICAVLKDRDLPCSDMELRLLAEQVMTKGVVQGRLTISNAQQWRLQYTHVLNPPIVLPF